MVNQFRIAATSDRFWNLPQFVEFLFRNRDQAIYLNIDPEAVCLRSLGVYDLLESLDFQDVTVITYNPLEYHANYTVHLVDNQWFSIKPKIDPELHRWNGRQLFYALFGRPTAARLAIASYLQEKHSDVSHIHFSASIDIDNLEQFELNKLLLYDIESLRRAGNLIPDLPLLLSSTERYTAFQGYDYNDPLTNLYQDILIDVVVETHVLGNTFFPTEKTLRSIWLKKPFIMFASRDYLCYLRQMGFKTFWEFWDEDYDGYETRDRLIRIYQLLDKLAALSSTELWQMYQDMQPILDHNHDLMIKQTYSRKITKVDQQI
jgi:hypothetical protein